MPFRKHASLVVVADGHTSVTEQLGGAVHRGTLERRARGLRTPAVEVGVTLRSTLKPHGLEGHLVGTEPLER